MRGGLTRARALLRPQFMLPVLLAGALLAFAAGLGDPHRVQVRLAHLRAHTLWIALAAAACYLACKAAQLKLMLAHIDLRVPGRAFWLAFAIGELTVTLPLGIFSQNWMLASTRHVRIARSSAATVMMVLAEIAVVFAFLAVVGVPHWPAARIFAIAMLAAIGLALAGLMLFEHGVRARARGMRRRWSRCAMEAASEMVRGLRQLSTPAMLAVSLVLAAVYLGALAFAFWQVGQGMRVPHLDWLAAATIYAFALAMILIGAGLFSQIGTMELLGMVAARAWGIGYADGLALMLGFRLVWTGAIWLLCLPIVASLWREMPRGRTSRSRDRRQKVAR